MADSSTQATVTATQESLTDLNGAIDAYVKSTGANAVKAVDYVAVGVVRDATRLTRVNTGRLKAGFTPGFNLLGVSPEPITGKNVKASAKAEGVAAGSARKIVDVGGLQYGVEIRNAVRYGPYREAVDGMIRRAVDAWHGQLAIAIREGRKDGVS